jgi:hypothetical protein
MASVRNAKAGFRTVGFGFCREAVVRKCTADEMPDRTVSAALSGVGVFVGAVRASAAPDRSWLKRWTGPTTG